jgi:putative ABC transport system permease protein
MSLIRRMRAMLQGDKLDRNLDEELRSHVEMRAQDNITSGMNAEEARYAAQRRFGNTTLLKEDTRAMDIIAWLDTAARDLRYAARMLRRSPGFTMIAVLTLALGIGANTAIFSVIDAVLLRPLPYPNAKYLVRVEERHEGWTATGISYANFLDLKNNSQSLSDVAAMRWWTANLADGGEPESVQSALVSAEYFSALGIQPFLGRVFTAEEDQPGKDNVILIAHGLWQRRYGSNPQVIGRNIKVNDELRTIIGIMPPGFREPFHCEIWAPLVATGDLATNRRSHLLFAVARLNPGISLNQANAEMRLVSNRIQAQNPGVDPGFVFSAGDFQERSAAPLRTPLLVLFCAAGCVLLIACTNLAGLLLARGAARNKEFAIRASVGAPSSRLVRQLLTESLLLGGLGGAFGLLLAFWCLALVKEPPLNALVGYAGVSLDLRVLLFAVGASLATGILCGLAPAFHSARGSTITAAQLHGRATAGIRNVRLRSFFVVSEVALAFVLLVGAGLLIHSFATILRQPIGFNPDTVLTMQLFLSEARYPSDSPQAKEYLHRVLEKLESVHGVQSVGMIDALPLTGGASTDIEIVGRPISDPNHEPEVDIRIVSPGFFRTLDIPLRAGRWFTDRDTFEAPRVMIINETMARQFWPNENPIGRRVTMKDWGPPLTGEIVGIAADVRLDPPAAPIAPALYWPYPQFLNPFSSIVVRLNSDAKMVLPDIKSAIWSVDKEQTIASIQTFEDILADTLTTRRINMSILATLAALALLLASLGIYGVLANSVVQRTQEIGVRLALGARPGQVLAPVIGQGLRLTTIGLALGFAAALAVSRLLSGLLFGIKATDPLTFLGVAILLTLVAMAACYIPARRAMRVDPIVALRYE